MKKSKRCPKCSSLRVGFLPFQPEQSDDRAVRSVATHSTSGMFSAVFKIGTLEATICTECGYHETYVTSPEQIEWSALDGFRWLNEPAPEDGPYR